MNPHFVHLRLHTEYSISHGLVRIAELIECAQAMKMPAVAITDEMNVFGLIKFYTQALRGGIKPIIGSDLWVYDEKQSFLVTVLCQNKLGYQHLTQLLTDAYLKRQDKSVTVSLKQLLALNEGLLLILPAWHSDVAHAFRMNRLHRGVECMRRWLLYFKNRVYVEVSRTQRLGEEDYIQHALRLSKQFKVPLLVTNDVQFLSSSDFEAHEARVCIHKGRVLQDEKRPRLYNEHQYFKTSEQMQQLFSDIPEALLNSVEVAKRCNLMLELDRVFLPKFPLPAGTTLENYLVYTAKQALAAHVSSAGQLSPSFNSRLYDERLRSELDVINGMGFGGYYLIVADFIQWAKQKNIPVGPGRGSGAGSLTAYLLGITALDPVEHGLLFERFLNQERRSMPDFDIDICIDGRDRVIDYVADRYGKDCVTQIITYGTMAAKAVVRDVGRVLGLPYGYVDVIAKLIPFELGITLKDALKKEPLLNKRYQDEEEVRTLIDLAMRLEGLVRNVGKHAGGVVISPTKLTDFTPLYRDAIEVNAVTQFDKDDLERVGLVKFDILGLRTLTIVNRTEQRINANRDTGQDVFCIDNISFKDVHTFDVLKSGHTAGVFQLESPGMRDLIRKLKPDRFEDIIALVALFRPGPLQSGMVDDFINRKHGLSKVTYLHPMLEPILRSTYGVVLYQEQVMLIAQSLAGYSLGQADILRRAMGKKKPGEMAKQRETFLKGAISNGIDAALAHAIFDLMEKFAGYGFNKSHSAAYAVISYQTAWLKTHYPAEFMAATLSADMDNTDKIVKFVYECKRLAIELMPPNVNIGHDEFIVSAPNRIEYGLGAIKGVGKNFAKALVENRQKKGSYRDFFDLSVRLYAQKLNRRLLEALIISGACDVFFSDQSSNSSKHRANLIASIDKALRFAEQSCRNQTSGQIDLFDLADHRLQQASIEYVNAAAPWTDKKRLHYEKKTLGLYLSGHPLDDYDRDLKQLVQPIDALKMSKGKKVSVVAMIIQLKKIMTSSQQRMVALTLEDLTGCLNAVIFSDVYEQVYELLNVDTILVFEGEVLYDKFNAGLKLMVHSVTPWIDFRANRVKSLSLHIGQKTDDISRRLGGLLKPSRGGNCPVFVHYRNEKAKTKIRLGDKWSVRINDDLLNNLNQVFGRENVVLSY
jgi:DNA polymerase-3 subunit alpha